MEVPLDFNVGDLVFYMEDNKVCERTIERICIHIIINLGYHDDTKIQYGFEDKRTKDPVMMMYKEATKIFKTKDQLLQSL